MISDPLACCPDVTYLELAWTVASLLVLASALHFMALRTADLWLAWRVRAISPPEWIIAQSQLRHMTLRSLKAMLAGGVGVAAMATPPGVAVAGNLGAWALLGIVGLLALDQLLDEFDAVRLSVAVRRERERLGHLTDVQWTAERHEAERRESAH